MHKIPQESHHMSEGIVQVLLELCQAWYCDYFFGQPVPMPNHPLGKELFPDIQPKLTQPHPIFSSPVTGYDSEEIGTCPSAFS